MATQTRRLIALILIPHQQIEFVIWHAYLLFYFRALLSSVCVFQVMELKGQMLHLPESNSIMFLGSPRVDRLEELMGRGLHLSDIPIHDATRDVILVGVSMKSYLMKELWLLLLVNVIIYWLFIYHILSPQLNCGKSHLLSLTVLLWERYFWFWTSVLLL